MKLKGFSLLIKNKKFATLVTAIVHAKTKRKQLIFLRFCFFTLNRLLTSRVGLAFTIGGTLDYTHFILIVFRSTLAGLIVGLTIANPLASALLPLAILYGRGIENILDPYEECKAICKVVEKFHNKQLTIKMNELDTLLEDALTALQLPRNKAHLLCVEEKLSLL